MVWGVGVMVQHNRMVCSHCLTALLYASVCFKYLRFLQCVEDDAVTGDLGSLLWQLTTAVRLACEMEWAPCNGSFYLGCKFLYRRMGALAKCQARGAGGGGGAGLSWDDCTSVAVAVHIAIHACDVLGWVILPSSCEVHDGFKPMVALCSNRTGNRIKTRCICLQCCEGAFTITITSWPLKGGARTEPT